jgi:tetratricopeptide (TPR) repeat protein
MYKIIVCVAVVAILTMGERGIAADSTTDMAAVQVNAEQGNANAQVYLGICYFKGNGVRKDMGEAAKWWRKAAEQGDAMGQSILGDYYDVCQNKTEAIKWWRKAAEQGDANAKQNLEKELKMNKSELTWYEQRRKAINDGYYGESQVRTTSGSSNEEGYRTWYRKQSDGGSFTGKYLALISDSVVFEVGGGPSVEVVPLKIFRPSEKAYFKSNQPRLAPEERRRLLEEVATVEHKRAIENIPVNDNSDLERRIRGLESRQQRF